MVPFVIAVAGVKVTVTFVGVDAVSTDRATVTLVSEAAIAGLRNAG